MLRKEKHDLRPRFGLNEYINGASHENLNENSTSSEENLNNNIYSNGHGIIKSYPNKKSSYSVDYTVIKERKSYLTVLSETDSNYRFLSMRLMHFIILLDLSALLDFYLYPQRFSEYKLYWSFLFQSLYPVGVFHIITFHVVFFYFWLLLRVTSTKLMRITLGAPIFTIYMLVPIYLRTTIPMGTFTAGLIVAEQLRSAMKIIAITVDSWSLSEHEKISFSEAFYYFYAPTFLFQRNYPRTASIDYGSAFMFAFRFVTVFFHGTLIVQFACYPLYQNLAQDIAKGTLIYTNLFSGVLLTFYLCITSWYLLFHVWLNFWAEIMRYGDRLFYENWWSVSTEAEWMKRWNIVVHCFLKRYIHKQIQKKSYQPSLAVGLTLVFSMIFHEKLAFMVTRAVPPFWLAWTAIYFILLLLGFNITTKKLNQFVITVLFLNMIVYLLLLGVEHQFRVNCPPLDVPKFLDPLVPYTFFGKNFSTF